MTSTDAPLADLAIALVPIMPSEAAAPHAGREWQAARRSWLRALERLGLSEDVARDLHTRLPRPANEA